MSHKITREDAEEITRIVMSHARDFNIFLASKKDIRNSDQWEHLKTLIGNLMGAQYFEVIEVIGEDYKDIIDRLSGMRPS